MISLLLIVVQLVLLWRMVIRRSVTTTPTVWDRYADPLTTFSLFYLLFFMLPQFYGWANSSFLVGYTGLAEHREAAFVNAQVVLCAFLILVWAGASLVKKPNIEVTPADIERFTVEPTRFQLVVLGALFLAGFFSYVELGQTLQEIDGFRSELVKTTRGRILTTIAFAGNFACAAFLTLFIEKKQYARALLLIGLFGSAVASTGSRGRLMWPILIGIVVAGRFRPNLNKSVLAALGTVFVAVLVLLDQITANIFGGRERDVDFDIGILFTKRNFDGFPNFALIFDRSRQEPELSRLATGASQDFMNEFFPEILQAGVGFGATTPGWLFLSGGLVGLLILSAGFGITLGLFGRWHARARGRWAATTYLFAMSWYTAVGGNLVESLDKMIAAMAPGFVMWLSTTKIFQSKNPRRPSRPAPAFDTENAATDRGVIA